MEVRNCKRRWELKKSSDGKRFYVDHKRKKTTWSLPENCDKNEVVIVNPNFHFRWVKKTAPASSGRSAGKPYYVDYWNLSTHWQPPSIERRWDVIALFAFCCSGDVGTVHWGAPGTGLVTDTEFSYKSIKSIGEMSVTFTEKGLWFSPTQLTVVVGGGGKKKKGSRVGEKSTRIGSPMDGIYAAYDCGVLSAENAKKCIDMKAKLRAAGLSAASAKAAAAAIEAKAKPLYHVQVDMRDSTKYVIIVDEKKNAERLVKCIQAGLQWFQGKSIDYMIVNRDQRLRNSSTIPPKRNSSSSSSLGVAAPAGRGRHHSTSSLQQVGGVHSSPSLGHSHSESSQSLSHADQSRHSGLQRAQSDVLHPSTDEPPTSPRMQIPVLCQPPHSTLQQEPTFIAAPMQMPMYYMPSQPQPQVASYPSVNMPYPMTHQQLPLPGQPMQSYESQAPPYYAGPPPGYYPQQAYLPMQVPQQDLQSPPSYVNQNAPLSVSSEELPPIYGSDSSECASGDASSLPMDQLRPEPPAFDQSSPCQSVLTVPAPVNICPSPGVSPPSSPGPSPGPSPVPSPRHSAGDNSLEALPSATDAVPDQPCSGRGAEIGSAVSTTMAIAATVVPVIAVATADAGSESLVAETPDAVMVLPTVGETAAPVEGTEPTIPSDTCGRAWLETVAAVDFPAAFSRLTPVTSSSWMKFLAGSHHQRLDPTAKDSMDKFVNETGQWKTLLEASLELQSTLEAHLPSDHLVAPHVVAWSLLDIYLTAKATQGKHVEAAKRYLEVLGEEFLRFAIREALSLDVSPAEEGTHVIGQSGIVIEIASFATHSSVIAAKELQKKFLVLQSNGSVTRGLVPGSILVPLSCLLDLPTYRVLITARPFASLASSLSESQERALLDTRTALLSALNLPSDTAAQLDVSVDQTGLFRVNDDPAVLPRHTLAIFGRANAAARVRPELLQLLLNEELLQPIGHTPLRQPSMQAVTSFIVDVMIPAFLKVVSSWLEVLTAEFGFQILVYFLHVYGLNLRLLAVLRAGVPPDMKKIRRLFMTEMVARCLRNLIRQRMVGQPHTSASELVCTSLKSIAVGEENDWHLLLDELDIAFPGIGLPGNNDVNGKGEVTVTLEAIDSELLMRRALQLIGGYASDETITWLASTRKSGVPPGEVTLSPLSRATVPRALLWAFIHDKKAESKPQLLLTALLEYPLDDRAQIEFLDKAQGTFGGKALRAFSSTTGAIRSETLAPVGVRTVSLLSQLTAKRVENDLAPALDSDGLPSTDVVMAVAFALLSRFHSPCGVYCLNEGLARCLLAMGLAVAETVDKSDSDSDSEEVINESTSPETLGLYERAVGFLFASLHELQSHGVVSELLLDIYLNIIGILTCLPRAYPHRDHLLFSMAVYHLEAHDTLLRTSPTTKPQSAGLHLFMTTLSQIHPTTFGISATAMWKLRAYQCLAAFAKNKNNVADVAAFQQVIELCMSEGVDVSQIPEKMDMSKERFYESLIDERKALRKHTLPLMMQLRIDSITSMLGFYCKPWRRA